MTSQPIVTKIPPELLGQQNIERIALEAVTKCLPISFYWMDAKGILLGCNEKVLRDLRIEKLADFVGKHSKEVVTEQAWENSQQVIATGVATIVEEQHSEQETGTTKHYLSIKSPIVEQDRVVGLVGISIDITDRKRVAELELKNKAAQQVIDFTNMIAGSMAHELRTPVQGIGLQIDFLEQAIKSPKKTAKEKQHETLQVVATVKDAVNSMTYMISDMLLKIRSFATGEVPHHDLHLTSAVENITDFLKHYPLQDDARALLQINYTDNFYYMGDKILTRHILSNLTKNALRAIANSEKAKGECKITMEVQCNDDNEDEQFNYLIFRDNAIGMEPDFAARIFDQYVTKTKDKSGTGLGLTFAKMVMKLYGGDIICRSKLGEFTEFVLSFPKLSA